MSRMSIAVHFGKNLRACRQRILMSQEELSSRSSLHRTSIGLLERGDREPRLNTIVMLASGLSIPIDELFAGVTWKSEGFNLGKFEFADSGDVSSDSRKSRTRGSGG